MNALLVDDEPLARRELERLLLPYESIRVVAEAASVREASLALTRVDIDLVFLDIQLRGETGFDLVDELPADVAVVFVTAYDEHALEAFEVGAIDYLLKPVAADRLAETLARLTVRPRSERNGLGLRSRLYLRFGRYPRIARVGEIVAIVAEGDYSRVHLVDGASGLVRRPLAEWMAHLPEDHFFRGHRSAIVNLERVKHIERRPNRTLELCIEGLDDTVKVSRRTALALRERLDLGDGTHR